MGQGLRVFPHPSPSPHTPMTFLGASSPSGQTPFLGNLQELWMGTALFHT